LIRRWNYYTLINTNTVLSIATFTDTSLNDKITINHYQISVDKRKANKEDKK